MGSRNCAHLRVEKWRVVFRPVFILQPSFALAHALAALAGGCKHSFPFHLPLSGTIERCAHCREEGIRMDDMSHAAVSLAGKLSGAVVQPGGAEYEQLRRVWNHDVDMHPALIVLCESEEDIRRTLEFARNHELPIAIRGGGHSFAGHGTCDGGVVINLSRM